MSRSVSVIITDDLDGSENAETVSFGFRGVSYEVDPGKKTQAKLEGSFCRCLGRPRQAVVTKKLFLSLARQRPSARAASPVPMIKMKLVACTHESSPLGPERAGPHGKSGKPALG
jgi:hypothetical protein